MKKLCLVFSLIIAFASFSLIYGCKTPEPYTRVIILSGQSNMFGPGKLENISEETVGQDRYAKLSNPMENVKILMEEGESLDDFRSVQMGVGHVWEDSFGPELGVAEYFSTKCKNETVYVIKYALSGTTLLDTWTSPSRTDRDVTYAYENLTAIVDSGLKILKDANLNPKIIGFCWMQGESDACNPEGVEKYHTNLIALSNDLRERYNKDSYEGYMNFIDAKICPIWGDHVGINNKKEAFRKEDKKHNFLLDTYAKNLVQKGVDGLITNAPDDPHYDTLSVLKLGQMFAEQAYKLTK